MAIKTVCEVKIPVLDDEGNIQEVDGKTVEKTERFYLLHWGLRPQLVVNDKEVIPYTETVGFVKK